MNENQLTAIKSIGLDEERIRTIEKDCNWRFYIHTNGNDMRFLVCTYNGGDGLWIWIHNPIKVGVYVTPENGNNKRSVQEVFQKRLGTWAPDHMTAGNYMKQGRNSDAGHVGDWCAAISNGDFEKNFETIKGMVEKISWKRLELQVC